MSQGFDTNVRTDEEIIAKAEINLDRLRIRKVDKYGFDYLYNKIRNKE
jgi:hypothetical protein